MRWLKQVQLAERYDIAIMSAKGMSITAAPQLVDSTCGSHQIPLALPLIQSVNPKDPSTNQDVII
jgi:hypothetical protein